MQELSLHEVEQVCGGDFSPGLAAAGVGIASAAAGGAIFGPVGALGAGIAYGVGYGVGMLARSLVGRLN